MTDGELPGVRALSEDDLGACLELALDRGWKAEEAKWSLLLDVGDGLGIDDPDGGLAGAAIVTRYPPDMAVIGMLLIARRHGQRGVGRRLMQHALSHSPAMTVFLYATPQGMPLYERMDFQVLETVVKHVGRYEPLPLGAGPQVRSLAPADRPEVLRLDRVVFGADRRAILTAVSTFAEQVVVAEDDRGLVGHAAAWRNLEVLHIGPVVARDDAVARVLVDTLAVNAHGTVRIDVPERFAHFSRWSEERGLLPVDVAPLMVHGGHALPGARQRLYAPFMQALG